MSSTEHNISIYTRYIIINDNTHKNAVTVLWQNNELPLNLEVYFPIISAVETQSHAQYSERISSCETDSVINATRQLVSR